MAPITVNPEVFRRWYRHVTNTGRAPLLLWDDSNGAFSGTSPVEKRAGNYHGLQAEIRRRTGQRMFRSGVCPALTTNDAGTSLANIRDTMIALGGTGEYDLASVTPGYEDGWVVPGAAWSTGADVALATTWKTQGGSAFDEAVLPSTITVPNGGGSRYARWPATNTPTAYIGGTRYIGVKSTPLSPFGEYNRALKAWFVFKKILAGGTVRPTIRRDGTGTLYGQAAAATSLDNAGAAVLHRIGVTFTASVDDGTTDSRGCALHLTETGEADLSGDITIYWRYIEDTAVTVGAAVDLVCSLGSQSAREAAIFAGATDTGATGYVGHTAASLQALFTERMILSTGGIALNVFKFGMNDRNETEPSVGPGAVADGDSPEAFVDNFDKWHSLCLTAWTGAGYASADMLTLVDVGHALDPEDSELVSYFNAIADHAAGYLDTICVVDSSRTMRGNEMTSNSYYDAGGQSHLVAAGAREKWTRNFDALLYDYGGRSRARSRAR